MWCRQGERCKPTFIAGKNLVEHQEQLQDWAGKWFPVKTERPAGSMRHFRTGSTKRVLTRSRAITTRKTHYLQQRAAQPVEHDRGSNDCQ